MMWYLLNKIRHADGDEIHAEIRVPETSRWFDGHFPGEPVLPGVAQIGMVFDVLRTAIDFEISLLSVSRVRFKRIVRPGDRLKIVVSPMQKEAGANVFRILAQDELVCSGVMRIGKRS